MQKSWCEHFLWFASRGDNSLLGIWIDCSLFSQKELPQGSGRVWFATSEAQPLEICQSSAFGWYTLPFNGNLPPLPHTRTWFQAGGTTFSGKITATQGTQELHMSSHTAVECIRSIGHVADGWMPLAQQNFCILLLTYGVALYFNFSEFIWAWRAWSRWNN